MIHLRDDIATALSGVASGRVYHQQAPQDATYPLVIFFKQAGTPSWSFGGDTLENEVWTVKAVAKFSSDAETILDAIETALNDATIGESLDVRRVGDISYAEPVDGTIYRHLGGLYRIYA